MCTVGFSNTELWSLHAQLRENVVTFDIPKRVKLQYTISGLDLFIGFFLLNLVFSARRQNDLPRATQSEDDLT